MDIIIISVTTLFQDATVRIISIMIAWTKFPQSLVQIFVIVTAIF